MRKPEKLEAFQFADKLALAIYRITERFPKHEQFGLTHQLRRAAVSVPSNIVEGCSRHTEIDYLRFLDIAYGSLKEMLYQLSLANRLNYMPAAEYESIRALGERTARVLGGLIASMRKPRAAKAGKNESRF